MQDDFEQLWKNQLEINESLKSHIIELNKMIESQMCIPDVKGNMCDYCDFKKRAFMGSFHVEQKRE